MTHPYLDALDGLMADVHAGDPAAIEQAKKFILDVAGNDAGALLIMLTCVRTLLERRISQEESETP
jgi:hypothetical protein